MIRQLRLLTQQIVSANYYRAFHRFGQVKFAYGGLILGSSQFTLPPKLPLKITRDLKVVKMDS